MIAHWVEHGFGCGASTSTATCIGFTGLATTRRSCRPWRSAGGSPPPSGATATRRRPARAALAFGFGELGRDEIVSFTAVTNHKSRRVMEKLGMARDPTDDFDHPRAVPELRAHVLYRLPFASWERRPGAY